MVTDITVRDGGSYFAEDKSWTIGEHGLNDTSENCPLDFNLFTHANFADGFIRSGCLLGMVTATKKFGPYSATATDGRQTPLYHLINTVKIPANKDTVGSDAGWWHFTCREQRLPYKTGDGAVDAAAKTKMVNVRYV